MKEIKDKGKGRAGVSYTPNKFKVRKVNLADYFLKPVKQVSGGAKCNIT